MGLLLCKFAPLGSKIILTWFCPLDLGFLLELLSQSDGFGSSICFIC